jgi:hypothetical protein
MPKSDVAFLAKVAPDTYVQLALQLTWARLYPTPTPTYETATGRLFRHGRTETCRTLSEESETFARAFDDEDVLVRNFLRFRQWQVCGIDLVASQSFFLSCSCSTRTNCSSSVKQPRLIVEIGRAHV